MNRLFLKLCLAFIFYLVFGEIIAQGCSSAGFCTMGALKSDQKFGIGKGIKLNYVELSQLLAFSGLGETINATTLDISISVGTKNQFQIRLPYAWVNGLLGNTKAFGDVYLNYSRNLIKTEKYSINAMIGTKIPRATTDLARPDGLPLPFFYSPSLGTYDLILGTSIISRKWLLGIGFQNPIYKGVTDNGFTPTAYVNSPLYEQAKKYDASVNIKRGADIMLRIERNFRFSRYGFYLGLMPVFRLNADEITDKDAKRSLVHGSDGLAATALLGGRYYFDIHSSLKVLTGVNILQRAANPDGLMKTSLFSVMYEWQF